MKALKLFLGILVALPAFTAWSNELELYTPMPTGFVDSVEITGSAISFIDDGDAVGATLLYEQDLNGDGISDYVFVHDMMDGEAEVWHHEALISEGEAFQSFMLGEFQDLFTFDDGGSVKICGFRTSSHGDGFGADCSCFNFAGPLLGLSMSSFNEQPFDAEDYIMLCPRAELAEAVRERQMEPVLAEEGAMVQLERVSGPKIFLSLLDGESLPSVSDGQREIALKTELRRPLSPGETDAMLASDFDEEAVSFMLIAPVITEEGLYCAYPLGHYEGFIIDEEAKGQNAICAFSYFADESGVDSARCTCYAGRLGELFSASAVAAEASLDGDIGALCPRKRIIDYVLNLSED